MQINALFLTPYINPWMINAGQSRVLHIFDRACNLINEHGDVLSIVTTQIGNGPFNLVVEDDIRFSEHLRLESEISTSPTQLYLGDLTIHTTTGKIWNPHPDWKRLHVNKSDIATELAKLPIIDYPNPGGLDILFGKPSGLLNHRGLQIPQSLVSNLFSALVNVDISLARRITSQLAGLGAGLTPSGDDFIMGAIYAAWIIHPPAVASVLAKEIADTSVPLTTSLSAAWLRSAGRGEAGILWHEFFDVLVSNNHAQIEESMKSILAVGETSGADALAGFIGVFLSWMEKTGSSHG